MRRLISEERYSPIHGLNEDGNGLSISSTECADMINLRPLPRGVKTREGSQAIADFHPLPRHYHYFKGSSILNENLFMFSDDMIWKRIDGDIPYMFPVIPTSVQHDWVPVNEGVDVQTMTGLGSPWTDFSILPQSDSLDGVIPFDASHYGGLNELQNSLYLPRLNYNSPHFPALTGDEKYLMYWSPRITDASSIIISAGALRFEHYDSGNNLLATKDYLANETGALDSQSSIQKFYCCFTIWVPPAGTEWTAVKILDTELEEIPYIPGTGSYNFDLLFSDLLIIDQAFNCNFWSTAEVLDTDGIKLVVAGSNPPEDGDPEEDQADRVLWEYLDLSDTWQEKTTVQRFSEAEEKISLSGTDGAYDKGTDTFPIQIDLAQVNAETLVPGTFILFTIEDGVICQASSIEDSGGTGKYKLYNTDPDNLKIEESTSWIKADLSTAIDCEVEFLDTAGEPYATYLDGKIIYCAYSWKESFAFKPRHVQSYNNRLIVGSTYEDTKYFPWRARFSDVGDSNLFTQLDYSDLLEYGVESIETFKPLGSRLVCYTRQGLYVTNAELAYVPIWEGGTISGRTVATYNNLHYFFGDYDIYQFNGSAVQSITMREGQTRVRDSIYSLLDSRSKRKCFSLFYPQEKEIWFFVKGTQAEYPTIAYVYNVDRRIWTKFEFSEVSCAGAYRLDDTVLWDELFMTWDDIQVTWNEFGDSSGQVNPVLGYVSKPSSIIEPNLSQDTGFYRWTGGSGGEAVYGFGESIPWALITRDFIYGALDRKDRTIVVDFEATGDDLTAGINGDYSQSITDFEQTQDITITGQFNKFKYHPDFYDYAMRLSFVGDGFLHLRWIQPKANVFQKQGEA